VETDQREADVILTWPDLSGVPREIGLTLVDVEANQRVYLRTRQHYVYRAGDAPRRFQIVAEPNVLGSLAITQFTVQPARGGLTLTYQLSRSAAVQAEVRTLAGREVAPIAADTRAEGGMNTLPWTAQDEQGRPLPDGVYLVCLTATTEEGQVVRAVRPVAINR
jgi:hypothetical protein